MKHKNKRDRSSSAEDKENMKFLWKMKKMMSRVERRLKDHERSVSEDRGERSRASRRRYRSNERRREINQSYYSDNSSRRSCSRSRDSRSNLHSSRSRSRDSSLESCNVQVSKDRDKEAPRVERGEFVSPPIALTMSSALMPGPSAVSSQENPKHTDSQEQPEHEMDLQEDILSIMGPRLEADKQKAMALHKDVVIRWTEIFKQGLPKEEGERLLQKYQIPENCNFIVAPRLNPEVAAAVQENVRTRDKRISGKQERLASCLAAVGKAISISLKTDSSMKLELLEILSDVGRLLAFLQREESEIRKNLILTNLDSSLKDVLSNATFDGFLFGANLEEKVKNAKLLERTTKVLKPTGNASKPKYQKNRKGPPAQRQSNYTRNAQTSSGQRKPTRSSSKSRMRKPYPQKQSFRRH